MFAIFVIGCKKPFSPTVASSTLNVLVVEGIINVSTDSTIIKLSRTVNIDNKASNSPETKAVIVIENAQNASYPLTETNIKGTYGATNLNLDPTKQYRVRIKTTNGKVYLSDLVDAKVTPRIDSVGFKIKENGVQVYVNAHDATNATRYYAYNYSETWQFHARYISNYVTDGFKIVDRPLQQQIFYCYGRDTSSNIIINSTNSLTQDVVYQFPIIDIENTSEKIETKYSILVSQTALTKDAYNFYDKLRKNTEQLGSIFDAQPSQLTGNVHNIADASEPVIGYISAGTIQKKRIYITKTQLPQGWVEKYPYSCQIDTAINTPNTPPPDPNHDYQWAKVYLIQIPVHALVLSTVRAQPPELYTCTLIPCADCTIRGTTKQPAFWK